MKVFKDSTQEAEILLSKIENSISEFEITNGFSPDSILLTESEYNCLYTYTRMKYGKVSEYCKGKSTVLGLKIYIERE